MRETPGDLGQMGKRTYRYWYEDGVADPLGNAAYFAGMGAVLVAAGGLALRSYLCQTRPAAEGG